MTINPTLGVNQLLHRHPGALSILAAAGIDSCCGGEETLALAAQLQDCLARRGLDDRTADRCGCEHRLG